MKPEIPAMFLKTALLVSLTLGWSITRSMADDYPLFHSVDPLAPRDEYGLIHQMPNPNATDFAPRYGWRPLYWLEGKHDLIKQPAYVGALQRDLMRLGYYGGPIDGVYSGEVSDAIARLQKNYSIRVTGTLTVPVRRVLHLP
jgi:hypothetical protein